MIIVTGSVRARPDSIERALELSLEHVSPGRRGAQIVLGQPFREPRPVRTEAGDMVVWFAGCVPHTRDEVAEGERLTGLSMFYEPVR